MKENSIEQILKGVKEHQLKGCSAPCPRCGRDNMKANIHTNALSRHADVYVCDACGTDEAMRDFSGCTIPLKEWAAICNVERKNEQ